MAVWLTFKVEEERLRAERATVFRPRLVFPQSARISSWADNPARRRSSLLASRMLALAGGMHCVVSLLGVRSCLLQQRLHTVDFTCPIHNHAKSKINQTKSSASNLPNSRLPTDSSRQREAGQRSVQTARQSGSEDSDSLEENHYRCVSLYACLAYQQSQFSRLPETRLAVSLLSSEAAPLLSACLSTPVSRNHKPEPFETQARAPAVRSVPQPATKADLKHANFTRAENL